MSYTYKQSIFVDDKQNEKILKNMYIVGVNNGFIPMTVSSCGFVIQKLSIKREKRNTFIAVKPFNTRIVDGPIYLEQGKSYQAAILISDIMKDLENLGYCQDKKKIIKMRPYILTKDLKRFEGSTIKFSLESKDVLNK